jgi:sulfonate transport system substrate-binding protein
MTLSKPHPRWTSIPLLLGLLSLLGGCGGHAKSGQIVLRVGDQMHMLETMLKAAGEDEPGDGYSIEWSNFVGGPAVIAAQTGGSVDVGWMYETPLVFAQAAGSPIKVIAAARPVRPGTSTVALVVSVDSPIHGVADLKGRSVGYQRGTVTQYLLVRLLEQAGMSLTDVRSVNLTTLSSSLLQNGTMDAAVTVDPYLSQMLADGKARILASGGEPLTPDLQYIVASNRVLEDPSRAAALGDFILRMSRSMRKREEDPDTEAPIYAKNLGLAVPIIAQYLKRAPTQFTPIGPDVVSAQQTLADTFYKLGLVSKQIDAAQLFDHRYDELVAQDASAAKNAPP